MPESEPTADNPESGPDCPECGTETEAWLNHLSEEEHTYIISCPSCDFEIETESNLAADSRQERMQDRIDEYGAP